MGRQWECKFHCPTPFRPDNFGPGPCCHQPVFSYQIAEIGGVLANVTTATLNEICRLANNKFVTCSTQHSACIEDASGTWRCKCVSNYHRKQSQCVQDPVRLFTKSMQTFEIMSDAPAGSFIGELSFTPGASSLVAITSVSLSLDPYDIPLELQKLNIVNGIRLKTTSTISKYFTAVVSMSLEYDGVTYTDHVFITVSIKQANILSELNVVVHDGTPIKSVVSHIGKTNIYLSSLLNYKITINGTASDILTADETGIIQCSKTADVDTLCGQTVSGQFASCYLSGYITVILLDGLLQTEIASIQVNVLVLKRLVRVRIPEDTQRGTVIARFGTNNKWAVSSIDMNNEIFTIDASSLKIASSVDIDQNESTQEFEFNLNFKYASSSASAVMTVHFENVNDVRPVFSSTKYDIVIAEGTFPGSVVGYIQAIDADSPNVFYSITDTEANELFVIDGGVLRTKLIVTSGAYAAVKDRSFIVVANDGELQSLNSAEVFIEISSINNAQILDNVFTGSLHENLPAETFVTSAFISNYTDFKIIGAGSSIFKINTTTGGIMSTSMIDRENLKSDILDLVVTAYLDDDGGSCSLTVLGTAFLTVIDKNDNTPEFYFSPGQTLYFGMIAENSQNGTKVLTDKIFATDKDLGVNAHITYTMDATYANLFVINPQTAEITTVNSGIDREVKDEYELIIYAVDGNASFSLRNTGTATVQVKIEDENDNKPQFQNIPYSVNVNENTKTTINGIISATDLDAGYNGEVRYSIFDGDLGYFTINSSTGAILVDSLDREAKSFFNLVIFAADSGNPGQSSSTTLMVTVLDQNDNTPEITESILFKIAETSDCSQPLDIIIAATDDDSGLNSEIVFSTVSSDFSINITTGQLSCNNPLNYESQQEYTLLVTVKDKGTPPRSSSATVTVVLTDVNDNSPQFIPSSVFSVDLQRSDLKVDKPIVVMDVNDADSGENANVTIIFTEGNATSYFKLNSQNGVVRVKNSIIPPGLYFASLLARDNGEPSLNTTGELLINVLHDTNTSFSFTNLDFHFTIKEEALITDSLGQLTVSNPYNDQLTFKLILYDSTNFTVNQNGFVYCHSMLDREKVAKYQLVARVFLTDNQNVADVSLVHITVLDINDNTPSFPAHIERTRRVSENIDISSVVYSVDVVDLDSGINAQITYSSNMASPFAIDETTGAISVISVLDREKPNGERYNLTVTATDGGTPPRSALTDIVIYVFDYNDNTPEFEKSEYVFQVPEDTLIGTKISTVSATDADTDTLNRKVTYSVVPDSADCPLAISDEEITLGQFIGKLKLKRSLDRENQDVHKCVITATDHGEIPRTGTTNVTVNVGDINDNTPIITNYPSQINIRRDADIGSVVIEKLTTQDLDIGLNGEFQFNISANSGHSLNTYLLIDVDTGHITLNKNLADLEADVTLLMVDVKDKGSPPLSSTIQIIVNISDANVRPYFPSNYVWNILEESVTDDVLHVYALDIIEQETVVCNCTYMLRSGEEYFKMNVTTGKIKQIKALDRENFKNGIFTFEIDAEDNDPVLPKRTDQEKLTVVTVHIQDVNDNPPLFLEQYIFSILQDVPVGNFIGRAAAEDKDDNAISLYTLLDQSVPDAVFVNSSSGDLYVKSSLKRNTTATYEIQVKLLVQDTLKSSYFGRTIVRILVEYDDTNKHAPVFSQSTYRVTVKPETKSGSKINIPNFLATDKDTGREGELEYRFIDNTNYRDTFGIDITTGDITAKFDLNTIDVDIVNLMVVVTDKADVPKTGSAIVIIKIAEGPGICSVMNDQLSVTKEQRDSYFSAFMALIGLSILVILSGLFLLYKYLSTRATLKNLTTGGADSLSSLDSSKVQEYSPKGYTDPYTANAMLINRGMPVSRGDVVRKRDGYNPTGPISSRPLPYRDLNFRERAYFQPIADYNDDDNGTVRTGRSYLHPMNRGGPRLPPRF